MKRWRGLATKAGRVQRMRRRWLLLGMCATVLFGYSLLPQTTMAELTVTDSCVILANNICRVELLCSPGKSRSACAALQRGPKGLKCDQVTDRGPGYKRCLSAYANAQACPIQVPPECDTALVYGSGGRSAAKLSPGPQAAPREPAIAKAGIPPAKKCRELAAAICNKMTACGSGTGAQGTCTDRFAGKDVLDCSRPRLPANLVDRCVSDLDGQSCPLVLPDSCVLALSRSADRIPAAATAEGRAPREAPRAAAHQRPQGGPPKRGFRCSATGVVSFCNSRGFCSPRKVFGHGMASTRAAASAGAEVDCTRAAFRFTSIALGGSAGPKTRCAVERCWEY